MAGHDRSRADQIRALIEEMDRVRDESQRVIDHIDRSMKHPFWPERRRMPRVPPPPDEHQGSGSDAT